MSPNSLSRRLQDAARLAQAAGRASEDPARTDRCQSLAARWSQAARAPGYTAFIARISVWGWAVTGVTQAMAWMLRDYGLPYNAALAWAARRVYRATAAETHSTELEAWRRAWAPVLRRDWDELTAEYQQSQRLGRITPSGKRVATA